MIMTRLACLGMLALLAACGGSVPTTHYYVLEPRDLARSAARAAEAPSVGVTAFQVDSPYDQDRIVYRVGAETPEVKFYSYHRWATPLARMLPQLVASELSAAEGSVPVRIEVASSDREYAAELSGRLLALEEIDTAEGQIVRVRLQLMLRQADGREIWSKTLDDETTVSTREVTVIVEQMRRSLAQAVRAAGDEMATSLAGLPR